jgi:carbonic anhydrase
VPHTSPPASIPPDEALERLREGNQRFVRGDGSAVRRWHPRLVEGQSPFAVVLGCSDSRAPAEYVFDQGLGDLFVVRVAGPVIAPSLVGSVEFAASEFGTRLVVVMGHTHCGAVGATVKAALGSGPSSSNVRSIIDRIAPNLEHLLDAPPAGSAARLDAAVRANAMAVARELRHASQALQELVDRRRVVIVSAVYDLETGVVTFHDEPASEGSTSLERGA